MNLLIKKNWIIYSGIILISLDVANIQIGSIHLRLAQFFLPILFLITKKYKIEIKYIYILSFLALTALPSLYISFNLFKSIPYLLWIVYNFIFVYYFFYCLTKHNPKIVIDIYINLVRFYILISFIIFIFNGFDRVSLFFYEPSFFVIFVIPFIAFVFFAEKINKIIDIILLILFYFFTKSALLLVAVGFMLIFWCFSKINIVRLLILFILVTSAAFFLNRYDIVNSGDINLRVLYTFISSDQGIEILLMRGGNRWPRFLQSLDIALLHPIIGVGLGAYEDFQLAIGGYNYEELEVNIPDEDGGFGRPAVNIFTEMIATAGFGFLCAFLYFISSCFSQRIFKSQFRWFGIGVILIIVALQFESNFMRLYLWAFLGILLGLKDFLKNEQI